jgi:hypothetical protein
MQKTLSNPAMANPQPLKFSNAALLQSLKKRYFGAKSIRSLEKIQILALKMAIFFKNVVLEAIWVGHG